MRYAGVMPKREPTLDRFLRKFMVSESGCHQWTAATQKDGYAIISDAGKPVLAHRWSYQHFIGPIPDGLTVNHRCRNRPCVNPDHLELLTHADNVRYSADLGAYQAGDTCRRGHAWDGHFKSTGARRCVRCEAARAKAKRMHFACGHPVDEEHTYIDGRGRRRCGPCRAPLKSAPQHTSAPPDVVEVPRI